STYSFKIKWFPNISSYDSLFSCYICWVKTSHEPYLTNRVILLKHLHNFFSFFDSLCQWFLHKDMFAILGGTCNHFPVSTCWCHNNNRVNSWIYKCIIWIL